MPAHDEDHWALVFSDTYTVLLERAPEAPTLEEMTTVSLDSTQTASKPSRPVWAVVMAAAAVVVLVGGAAWLSRLTEPNPPLATIPPSLPVVQLVPSPARRSHFPPGENVQRDRWRSRLGGRRIRAVGQLGQRPRDGVDFHRWTHVVAGSSRRSSLW